jgi:prolyl 4-hydroxylase
LTRPAPEATWDKIEDVLREPPGLDIGAPSAVSDRPFVRRFAKLLSVEESEYLIGLSSRYLVPAEVLDRSSGERKQSGVRTNSVAVFWPAHQDLVVHAINLRLAKAADLPPVNGELLNVLMYRPGEEYRPHFDFFPVEIAKADPNGQRIRTLLVYLNDDFDGGETNFVTQGLKIKGAPGDAILFHNCDAAGAPDRSTLHAGLPVTRGEKWLLSKWFRDTTFTPVNAA